MTGGSFQHDFKSRHRFCHHLPRVFGWGQEYVTGVWSTIIARAVLKRHFFLKRLITLHTIKFHEAGLLRYMLVFVLSSERAVVASSPRAQTLEASRPEKWAISTEAATCGGGNGFPVPSRSKLNVTQLRLLLRPISAGNHTDVTI